ncbi:MAG: hypothetical protein V1856_02925 [Candidatus Liptonbacteria bacterium]
MKNKKQEGYIAIASALIISGTVILLVSAMGLGSFLVRNNISDSYYKERSYALAEACVQAALLRISENQAYAGGEDISVASDTCSIVAVESSSTYKVIRTQAVYQNSYTNLQVGASTSTILNWQEMAE